MLELSSSTVLLTLIRLIVLIVTGRLPWKRIILWILSSWANQVMLLKSLPRDSYLTLNKNLLYCHLPRVLHLRQRQSSISTHWIHCQKLAINKLKLLQSLKITCKKLESFFHSFTSSNFPNHKNNLLNTSFHSTSFHICYKNHTKRPIVFNHCQENKIHISTILKLPTIKYTLNHQILNIFSTNYNKDKKSLKFSMQENKRELMLWLNINLETFQENNTLKNVKKLTTKLLLNFKLLVRMFLTMLNNIKF